MPRSRAGGRVAVTDREGALSKTAPDGDRRRRGRSGRRFVLEDQARHPPHGHAFVRPLPRRPGDLDARAFPEAHGQAPARGAAGLDAGPELARHMKIDPDDFRVPDGAKVSLRKWPTGIRPLYGSESHYKELLAADVGDLSDLQRLLYASNAYSLLLIFQALDAAGKDGAISHVLSGVNPQGCEVHSFKHPSPEELEHDFLWRTTCRLPARGRIGVFNRSYYEEVLIVRVHPGILESERIPGARSAGKAVWKSRYRSIVDFEKHLH